MKLMVAQSSRIGTAMEHCRWRLRNIALGVDVLDSELPSLDNHGSARVRRKDSSSAARSLPHQEGLTARTLNNDVLPAFCSPIMVMSISVALHDEGNQRPSRIIAICRFAFLVAQYWWCGRYQLARQASRPAYSEMSRSRKFGIPEQAQQPVVDTTKEVRHGR
jgi:hypothetical protein